MFEYQVTLFKKEGGQSGRMLSSVYPLQENQTFQWDDGRVYRIQSIQHFVWKGVIGMSTRSLIIAEEV